MVHIDVRKEVEEGVRSSGMNTNNEETWEVTKTQL